MLLIIFFIVTLFVQAVTVYYIYRLAKDGDFRWIWGVFLLAVIFRTVRVVFFFVEGISGKPMNILASLGEVFGFFISILLLIILIWLRNIFSFFYNKISDLKKMEEKYENLIRHSYDGIIIMQDKVFKLVNPRFCELLGYKESELLGEEFLLTVGAPFKKIVAEKDANRLSGKIKNVDQYEMTLLKKDGTEISVEVSVSLIDYEDRPATLKIIRDISRRSKKEEESEKVSEDLMRINQNLVGRELKMLELKKENEELKKMLNKK